MKCTNSKEKNKRKGRRKSNPVVDKNNNVVGRKGKRRRAEGRGRKNE